MRRALLLAAVVGISLPLVTTADAAEPVAALRAGVGVADATWHVGSGGGQYAGERDPSSEELDPHGHSTKQPPSQGVASRMTMRAIVVEGADGQRVALLKSDLYLAQDHLLRRVGQLLADAGSPITPDEILHTASHNHSSPYYSTPSWGVWAFQDVVDLRAFEFTARAMAEAILAAEADLRPARMGATTVEHSIYKGNIMGPQRADDGSPAGYPRDFGDDGLVVMRFEEADTGEPIAAWMNFGQHPESLDGYHMITADFLGPLERFVDRELGAPLVFSQGDVGSAEGPYLRDDTEQLTDSTWRAWAHVGHAQTERGARLLADDVLAAWEAIGRGDATVPLSSDHEVAAMTYWAPGPVSHPYPSVSNCRSETTAEGNPGAPVLGLPDCARARRGDSSASMAWENLKAHGIPVPEHYDAPAFTGVEENLRLKLQAIRIGEVLLASCACEAQVDLILNIESRANQTQGDIWDGYPWDEHCVAEGDGYLCDGQPVSAAAYDRMYAQIHNDAAGWDAPENAVAANSEPSDPADIWGNFTKEELPPDLGYALPVGVGHAADYNGYVVSYREYMAYDHYRKALTAYGPHTADYMATRLVRMAGALKGGPDVPLDPGVDALDEARQEATSQALGRAAGAAYDAWLAALPDDVGPAEALAQPETTERFAAATFSWRGGSNAVDNPVARVERLEGDAWVPYADQTGEVQTILDLPDGLQGVADTWTGRQEWVWTASFEAFDAFPATLGQVPDGTYRFVVDGVIRQDGADEPYRLESEPFEVVPWDGIVVRDLRLEPGGDVSFAVDPIVYPRTYSSPIRMIGDDGNPRVCKTCSFRPWASTAEVASATVTVLGPNEKAKRTVAATLQGDRWFAATRLRPNEIATIDGGAVVDTWGEINGEAHALHADGVPVAKGDAAGPDRPAPEPVLVADATGDGTTSRPMLPIAGIAGISGALVLLLAGAFAIEALRRKP